MPPHPSPDSSQDSLGDTALPGLAGHDLSSVHSSPGTEKVWGGLPFTPLLSFSTHTHTQTPLSLSLSHTLSLSLSPDIIWPGLVKMFNQPLGLKPVIV